MQVLYRSTRGTDKAYTASEAILKGLSEDGGLFGPDRIPKLDLPLSALAGMTYQETAYEVMRRFLTDFTAEELKQCIENAYDEKFDTPKIFWLRKTALFIWNCSTEQPLHLKIWRFPFFLIC